MKGVHNIMKTQTLDLTAIKGRQQKAWSAGDYGKVGVTLPVIAELLAETVDLYPGQSVLDVACGNGNTSLAAARRFCDVVGIDYVPMLLDEGRQRAQAEGLMVDFREGEAENLPFPDGSFDVVLSSIGVIFAPDQEKAAAELMRVCKPGGKIGMANWVPDGYVGDLFKTMGKHVPPPPVLKPPSGGGPRRDCASSSATVPARSSPGDAPSCGASRRPATTSTSCAATTGRSKRLSRRSTKAGRRLWRRT
jgi:SAM-dependent methyltransferase